MSRSLTCPGMTLNFKIAESLFAQAEALESISTSSNVVSPSLSYNLALQHANSEPQPL